MEAPSDTKCSIFSKKLDLTSARAQFFVVFCFLSFSKVYAQNKNLNRNIRRWWIRVVFLCRVSRFASILLTGWLPPFTFISGEAWGPVLPKRSAFRLYFHFRMILTWGGGRGWNNPLQITYVEADMTITAIHFRAYLSLLIMKLRGWRSRDDYALSDFS